jgi:hypothetical protein
MSHMVVQYGEISPNKKDSNNQSNKDAIYNVTKVVAKRSTLMQIARAKVPNGFH